MQRRYKTTPPLLATLLLCSPAFAIDAPQVSFDGQNLNWSPLAANSYNIHNGDGDYIETLGAHVNSWAVPESGRYFVVATDGMDWRSWGRSDTVSATLTGSSDNNATVEDNTSIDETAQPLQPLNFRSSVYSTTAVELFWQHAADYTENRVVYAVYQDGNLIAEWLDASSLFINNLQAGTNYQFEIVAVANALTESQPVTLELVTKGTAQIAGNTSGLINEYNFEQIIADAVAMVNMNSATDVLDAVDPLSTDIAQAVDDAESGNTLSHGLSFLSSAHIDDGSTRGRTETSFGCAPDGLVLLDAQNSGLSPFTNRTTEFSDCALNNANYSGNYTYTSGRRSDVTQSFDDLQQSIGSQVVSVDAERRWTYPWISGQIDIVRWNNASVDVDTGEGRTTVTDMNILRTGVDFEGISANLYPVTDLEGQSRYVIQRDYSSELTADFNMASPATGQQAMTVDIDLSLDKDYWIWNTDSSLTPARPDYPVSELGSPILTLGFNQDVLVNQEAFNNDAYWQSGKMVITASDGSSVSLSPSTTNPEEAVIVLGNNEQSVTVPWRGTYNIHCSSVILGCGDNARPRFAQPRDESTRFSN